MYFYILTEKVPLWMLCGIVISKLTVDADGRTKKRPLIHSKVKTVWAPKLVSIHPNVRKIQNFGHICSDQDEKYKMIAVEIDFSKNNFWDSPGQKVLEHLLFFLWFSLEFAAQTGNVHS